MNWQLTTIEAEQIDAIIKSTQKAYEQIRPQLQYGIEVALKQQKEFERYLPQILKQIQSIQPFILESSKVYFVSQPVDEAPAIREYAKELVPEPKKLGKSIVLVAGNSFKYNQKPLRAVSLNSKPGRLLYAILDSKDHFVTDKTLFNRLDVEDTRALSWIRRDLKDLFSRNGLILVLERRKNPDGYILIDIEKQG